MIFTKILKNTTQQKREILNVFDMIAEMLGHPIVVFRGRKLNICLVYISQSYLAVPKTIRLNSTYYFVIRILNNRKLQQIAIIVSTDINFQDFMNL